MTMHKGQEYLEFLKRRPLSQLPVGERVPREFFFDRSETKASIHCGATGTVIFFMSKTCEKCDFSIINTYSENLYFKTYLFVDADPLFVTQLQKQFPHYEIRNCHLSVLYKELGVEAVPMVYALNKVGQIVGAGLFNTYESLLRKISPLTEVFGIGRTDNEGIS